MPSPVGHFLAGLTVGWVGEGNSERTKRVSSPTGLRPWTTGGRPWTIVLWCAVLAALPDADLLIPHFHRTATHSLTATVLVFILAAVVTGKVTGEIRWRLALVLATAYGTHLLLDWLGADPSPPRGFQLLWPFSDRFFISDLDLFPGTERRFGRGDFLLVNLYALLVELAILGPCALAAFVFRRTRRSRVPIYDRDVRLQPSGGAVGTADTSGRRALPGEP
jgi:membrane-bound metal-dependent hydrolase YbcI (DUF457 family)